MRLASYNIRGRTSFGAVVGEGIVDLRPRLAPRFSSALDLIRADALDEADAIVRGVRADFALSEAEFLTPVPGGEKILCIGVNYANRDAELTGGTENAEISEHVLPGAQFAGRAQSTDRATSGVGAARLRRRDRAGDRPRRAAHPQGARARSRPRPYAVQRRHHPRLAASRPLQRHPGQELRCLRQPRAVGRDRHRSRQAAAPDRARQRRGDAGRHHRQA